MSGSPAVSALATASDLPWSGRASDRPPATETEVPAGQHEERDQVVSAAIMLMDQKGISALTMQEISTRVAVEPARLAEVFPRLDDLLDAIVDAIVDQFFADPEVQPVTPDWQEYLQRIAHGVRRTALAHPQVFPLIATRPPAAPWLQPPLRSLRWMETFLESLHQCGFSDRAAVRAYRAFSSFLLGHLLLEVSALGADIGPIDQPDPRKSRPEDLDGYPRLAGLQQELTDHDSAAEFEESLESLLDRLAHDGRN